MRLILLLLITLLPTVLISEAEGDRFVQDAVELRRAGDLNRLHQLVLEKVTTLRSEGVIYIGGVNWGTRLMGEELLAFCYDLLLEPAEKAGVEAVLRTRVQNGDDAARTLLGRWLVLDGRGEEAFRIRMGEDPPHTFEAVRVAMLYGLDQKAADLLEAWIQANPDSPQRFGAMMALSMLQRDLGEEEEANRLGLLSLQGRWRERPDTPWGLLKWRTHFSTYGREDLFEQLLAEEDPSELSPKRRASRALYHRQFSEAIEALAEVKLSVHELERWIKPFDNQDRDTLKREFLKRRLEAFPDDPATALIYLSTFPDPLPLHTLPVLESLMEDSERNRAFFRKWSDTSPYHRSWRFANVYELADISLRMYVHTQDPDAVRALGFRLLEGDGLFHWATDASALSSDQNRTDGFFDREGRNVMVEALYRVLPHLSLEEHRERWRVGVQKLGVRSLEAQTNRMLNGPNALPGEVQRNPVPGRSTVTVRTLGLPEGIHLFTHREDVRALTEDGVWAGTSWGLIRYAGDEVLQIPLGGEVKTFFSSGQVLYVIGDGGLFRIQKPDHHDPVVEKIALLDKRNVWIPPNITDGEEHLHIGIPGRYALLKKDLSVWEFKYPDRPTTYTFESEPVIEPDRGRVKGAESSGDQLSAQHVTRVVPDEEKGWIYVLTHGGVTVLDTERLAVSQHWTVADGLPSNHVKDVIRVGDQVFFACQQWKGAGGLACLELDSGLLRVFTTRDGLSRYRFQSLSVQGDELEIGYGWWDSSRSQNSGYLDPIHQGRYTTFRSSLLDLNTLRIRTGNRVTERVERKWPTETLPFLGGKQLGVLQTQGRRYLWGEHGLLVLEKGAVLPKSWFPSIQVPREWTQEQRWEQEARKRNPFGHITGLQQVEAALAHPNPFLRANALDRNLYRLVRMEGIEPLLEQALRDPDLLVRREAVDVIVAMNPSDWKTGVLRRLVQDQDSLLRDLAVIELGRSGVSVSLEHLEQSEHLAMWLGADPTFLFQDKNRITEMLVKRADDAAFRFIRVLHQEPKWTPQWKQEDVEVLAQALSRHPEWVPILMDYPLPAYRVNHILRLERQFVARLFRAADPSLLDSVLPFLDHEDPDVVWNAALATGGIQDQRAVPKLLENLQTENGRLRHAVAWSLGQHKDPAAAPALEALLRETKNYSLRMPYRTYAILKHLFPNMHYFAMGMPPPRLISYPTGDESMITSYGLRQVMDEMRNP